jgi:hypothetical protein
MFLSSRPTFRDRERKQGQETIFKRAGRTLVEGGPELRAQPKAESLDGLGVPNSPVKAEQPDYDGKQPHERPRPARSDRHGDNPDAKGNDSCRD